MPTPFIIDIVGGALKLKLILVEFDEIYLRVGINIAQRTSRYY